jgi:uncharacterized protein (DUF1330 family)
MNPLITTASASSPNPVTVELEDTELWQRFRSLTNEMILTKGGRRMFPAVRANVRGMEADALYAVLIEFAMVENVRWRYADGEWTAGELAVVMKTRACSSLSVYSACKTLHKQTCVEWVAREPRIIVLFSARVARLWHCVLSF